MPSARESRRFRPDIFWRATAGGTSEIGNDAVGAAGIAAVLAVLLPGVGQGDAGRLRAGAGWCLAMSVAYWAILVPGFLLHAINIWSAYRAAEEQGGAAQRESFR